MQNPSLVFCLWISSHCGFSVALGLSLVLWGKINLSSFHQTLCHNSKVINTSGKSKGPAWWIFFILTAPLTESSFLNALIWLLILWDTGVKSNTNAHHRLGCRLAIAAVARLKTYEQRGKQRVWQPRLNDSLSLPVTYLSGYTDCHVVDGDEIELLQSF